ncbi:MAG: DUF4863 family protein [Sideroxyarcus sp.]|nr:DUF4863 family protein [Sideroxyarcus sp.]
MTEQDFVSLVARITGRVTGQALDASMGELLNKEFPPHGEVFKAIQTACAAGAAAGWICGQEHGGIRYGRVAKPGPDLHGFSIDVVEMADVVGPHHRHPNGEIDMIMPLAGDPQFDGQGPGWVVYPPNSAHRPTVAGGRAHVLYLLPDGAIEFTRT